MRIQPALTSAPRFSQAQSLFYKRHPPFRQNAVKPPRSASNRPATSLVQTFFLKSWIEICLGKKKRFTRRFQEAALCCVFRMRRVRRRIRVRSEFDKHRLTNITATRTSPDVDGRRGRHRPSRRAISPGRQSAFGSRAAHRPFRPATLLRTRPQAWR